LPQRYTYRVSIITYLAAKELGIKRKPKRGSKHFVESKIRYHCGSRVNPPGAKLMMEVREDMRNEQKVMRCVKVSSSLTSKLGKTG
jgi:hypothetical protein